MADRSSADPDRADHPQARRVTEAFRDRFGREPEMLVRSPGRVALLGAHVDYNEGWVLPAAIDRAVWLAASGPQIRAAGRVVAVDVETDTGAAAEAILDPAALPAAVADRSQSGSDWLDVPASVAWSWREELGVPAPAVDAVYGGDLPQGAGVSSSAAVEVAFLLAYVRLTGFGVPRRRLAELGRRAENEYLGVQSGIMDQFAVLHGEADRLVFLDCRDLSHELVPLPPRARVVVFDSGVRRRLSESGFNDRGEQCRQVVATLRPHVAGLCALRDLGADDLARHGHRLDPVLRRRAEHVVSECARVRFGAEVLRVGDLGTFGRLMRESHASTRDLYEVSIPEVDMLCEAAWQVSGCYGARLMGGGFGGCVAALCEADAVGSLVSAVATAWSRRYGGEPPHFVTRAAAGAEVLRV